ncbi:MAG: protein kinase domain-containing protein, partial [Acidobacteriota bacterium]
MGEVYRANDTRLKRDVAIKVLPAAFTADSERLARFEREAQLLAQLHHPNIASIFGLEESAGVRALVMELVEGPTLAERLEHGAIPLDEALPIARQIAAALEAAHDKGIVHRDLKPANVKLRADGDVKVLDFGLAKALDAGAASSPAVDLGRSPTLMNSPTLTAAHGTQLGVILGTAAYMAPEQAKGAAVDKRADIWAFGVVLFEMLSGERLFSGDSVAETLAGVLKTEIDLRHLPRDLPPAILHLLRRCLERNPKDRLRDIGEARIALSAGSESWDEAAGPSAASPAGSADGRRRAWQIAGGALLGALLAAGVAVWAGRRAAAPGMPIETDMTRITTDSGLTTDPAVSPTGSLLAYASDRGSANLNLWTQPLPAGDPVQVTHDDTDAHEPSFSPDGSRIVFRSERDGGAIYEVPALGGAERLIAAKGEWPRFSPDGRRIAYETGGRGSASELWVVDEAGGIPTRLAPKLTNARRAAWSPDGAALVVMGQAGPKDARGDWYRIDVASGTVAPMNVAAILETELATGASIDAWLPGQILFSARTGDSESIWSVGLSGDGRSVTGPVRRITAGTGLDESATVASGAAGRQLYFASLERRANLYRLP